MKTKSIILISVFQNITAKLVSIVKMADFFFFYLPMYNNHERKYIIFCSKSLNTLQSVPLSLETS